jgi:glycosyltransferase involved in cell wall biosynthesis
MSLNILFINSITIYGGGEVWMVSAAKELIKRGHNLYIACRPGSELEKHARMNNLNNIPLRISGDLDPFTIFRLARILSSKDIDIVLANTGKELRLSGIASRVSGKAKIVARHGIDFPLKNKFQYKLTYNYFTDIIIANSKATKNTLLKNAPWLDPTRIKVIYNGINLNEHHPDKNLRKEIGIPDETALIGFVGRLSIQKGIKYLLESFLFTRKFVNAHLLIAGTGELEKEIKEFISKNSLDDFVHLLGFREDINNIMNSIDVLLLPSLWEGFGIVLIEAMAAGKPCITTNISSMPEIVEDNVSGIIVPPEDSASVAKACIKILSDKELSSRMGREGKKIVKEKFTIEKMADRYEEVFNEVIKL